MERHGNKPGLKKAFLSGITLAAAISLFSMPANAGPDGQGSSTYRPSSKHYYYPDHYNSPYNYQSTGDFADHPMVVPPKVPVMKQPAYFIMDGPKARQVINTPNGKVYPNQVQPQKAAMPQQNAVSQPKQEIAPGYPAMQAKDASYSLHVGSFLVYSKADELEKKITELGLKSYRKEVAAEGIRYLQLRVGPFRNKDEMRQAATLLDNNKIKNRIALR